MGSSELDRLHHIRRSAAASDDCGVAIESTVPSAPHRVVARAVSKQQFTPKPSCKVLDVGATEDDLLAGTRDRFYVTDRDILGSRKQRAKRQCDSGYRCQSRT